MIVLHGAWFSCMPCLAHAAAVTTATAITAVVAKMVLPAAAGLTGHAPGRTEVSEMILGSCPQQFTVFTLPAFSPPVDDPELEDWSSTQGWRDDTFIQLTIIIMTAIDTAKAASSSRQRVLVASTADEPPAPDRPDAVVRAFILTRCGCGL